MHPSDDKGEMIARIVSAYAARPDVSTDDIMDLLGRLRREFDDLAPGVPVAAAPKKVERAEPAIPITQAVKNDKVYCLCCGKGFKMLKRHLGAEHGLSEAEYRAMFDLGDDFPLVAPSYSMRKAKYAKESGFGKHSRPGKRQAGRNERVS